jgi:hypothetical protein
MNKRVFISFAKEDIKLRDFLVGQRNNPNVPFDFVDMSVKSPWDSSWKTNCRTKIKGCDGMIAIVTNNSKSADGQIWEIKCAQEEGVPIYYIKEHKTILSSLPSIIPSYKITNWSWDGISSWIKTL